MGSLTSSGCFNSDSAYAFSFSIFTMADYRYSLIRSQKVSIACLFVSSVCIAVFKVPG